MKSISQFNPSLFLIQDTELKNLEKNSPSSKEITSINNPSKSSNLAFFLSPGSSLSSWQKSGLLTRELAPLKIFASEFNKVFIFTYGRRSELIFQSSLPKNIIIKPRHLPLPSRLYQYLLPFLHFPTIRRSHFLRTNQINGAVSALIAKRLNPKSKLIIRTGYTKSLFDSQAGLNNKPALKLESRAYAVCDLALVTSLADRDYLIKTHHLSPNKVHVVANYIDTDLFRPLPLPKLLSRLLFIGRAGDPQKNILALIKALSDTDLALDIVGKTKNTATISATAAKYNVSLNWLGIIPNDNLPQLINRYSIFILPSLYEGMPKSLLEAMSCGLACVATDVPGSREVITDEENGLLTEPTFTSLRAKIILLQNNTTLQQKLGAAARGFVVQNFSLKTQIQKEISIYQNLI